MGWVFGIRQVFMIVTRMGGWCGWEGTYPDEERRAVFSTEVDGVEGL